MKKHILALVLAVACISLYAVNPIKEGNMISGHVIVKGTEENIPLCNHINQRKWAGNSI